MTLQLEVIGPCLVLLAGGLLFFIRPAGVVLVVAEAACLALLLRLWQLSSAGSLVLPLYEPLPEVQLVFRVDHLGIFFAAVGAAAGLLVSAPWLVNPLRSRRPYLGWLLLAQAGMANVALAGGLETLAAGWAMAMAALCLLVLDRRVHRGGSPAPASAIWFLAPQVGGALLLLAGAATVEVSAGTGGFDAIPVGAIDSRAFVLMAVAPVVALLGLGAMVRALRDPLGCGLAVAGVVMPMSCYLLVRLYDLGDGRLPDPRLGAAIVVVGGLASLGFALSSLWAVDLGAALTRVVEAAAALLLVAAGSGSGLGVAAVATGAISVGLGASLAFAVLDAGHGRLPSYPAGRARLPATLATVAVLLALAWMGGLGGGLSTAFRISALQAALSPGGVLGLAALPALVGTAIMVYAAYGAGRFGGGALPSATDLVRLLLLGAALPATSLAAGSVIYPVVAPMAAGALRIPEAEVSNALATSPAGNPLLLLLFVPVIVVLAVLVRPGGRLDLRQGLPGAPGFLPPRLTVVPRILLARLSDRSRPAATSAVATLSRHGVLVAAALLLATTVSVTVLLR